MRKPLVIDLFCGLGGWAEGFLSEGYDCIGFDIERHDYGTGGYPGQLVLQDVTTLHGSQFRDADIIVASPPCQVYSYRAMPWKRAKALTPYELGVEVPGWWELPEYIPVYKRQPHAGPCMTLQDMAEWAIWQTKYPKPPPDNTLFDTCFRLQQEASAAAGRHIPLIVENVKGAQKWVGRASWQFGSFYLWGDVPALMPITLRTVKTGRNFHQFEETGVPSASFHGAAHEPSVQRAEAIKVSGMSWSGYGQPGYKPKGFNVTAAQRYRELEQSSRSDSRKAASAQIAKIPLPLARHIACVFKPQNAKIEA